MAPQFFYLYIVLKKNATNATKPLILKPVLYEKSVRSFFVMCKTFNRVWPVHAPCETMHTDILGIYAPPS